MSDSDRYDDTEPMERGIYLMADTPLTAHTLAVEGGGGDKGLLAEVIIEQLDGHEVDELINSLIGSRVESYE